jgi:uncharacterized membrane protein
MNKHLISVVIALVIAINVTAQFASSQFTFAAQPPVAVQLNKTVMNAGSKVDLTIDVAQLLGAEVDESTVRVYLSADNKYDFNDSLLDTYNFTSPAAYALSLLIPADVSAGNYYLLVIAQSETGVLLSKLNQIPVQVVR